MKLSLDTINEAPFVQTINSARSLISRDQMCMDQILANYEEDDHLPDASHCQILESERTFLETERGLISPD